MKESLTQSNISQLAANINKELKKMELDLKGRITVGYWRVGRWIARDILKNKDRAGYGAHLYEQLARKVSASQRTLERSVQLYRSYPIASRLTQLGWSHFLHLMAVKDEKQRRQLEHQAVVNGWGAYELKDRIKAAAAAGDPDGKKGTEEEIPQLTFVRGQVNTFALVEDEGEKDLLVDLGFRLHWGFAQIKSLRVKKDDCVKVRNDRFSKTACPPNREQLFTYKAQVRKIIDGDTLIARVHLNFRMFITQKFRLRGIDCPEIGTPEGKRAKRFVEERLKGLDFFVIKTRKDTTDKYERYLADVFYPSGGSDIDKIAREGNYLNQELLDAGLARVW
ncbi:MAG: hypothetical protein A3D87_01535 [Omnitrophica WOR_2 bacterium RIFCSPHIGHO2_02_FULL_50_17]|nr:MAG: hypothetical protein A3D87_01535 [Omnitrophica WOR_2 bacterium RIFCSPHIGHO2_02_FULL_50_17]